MLPGDVRAFLREAERRIERFQRDHLIPGFVASDFPRAYGVLHALNDAAAAPGRLFCEWGSGFGVPVEFVRGSFIPQDSEECLGPRPEFAWLTVDTGGDDADGELGPADADVVFAYPWPDEEQLIEALFERHAGAGTVLVSYHG